MARILEASESTSVTFRAKALRAVSLILAEDAELFGQVSCIFISLAPNRDTDPAYQANVRRTIENRMLDSSPSVRDAAIELVGKYVATRRDFAVEYLPKIAERVNVG